MMISIPHEDVSPEMRDLGFGNSKPLSPDCSNSICSFGMEHADLGRALMFVALPSRTWGRRIASQLVYSLELFGHSAVSPPQLLTCH